MTLHHDMTISVTALTVAHFVLACIVGCYHGKRGSGWKKRLQFDEKWYKGISLTVCLAIIGVASAAVHLSRHASADKQKRNRDFHIVIIVLAAVLFIYMLIITVPQVTNNTLSDPKPGVIIALLLIMMVFSCVVYVPDHSSKNNQTQTVKPA